MATFALWFLAGVAVSLADTLAGQPTIERMILLDAHNATIATIDGEPTRVVIDSNVDVLLRTPNAQITITHNHPHSVGLSVEDLLQLTKPGVLRVIAIAADGSRYEAARGGRYDSDHFETRQFKTAYDQVVRQLALARAHDPLLPSFDGAIAHLTSIALAKADVIRYSSSLSGGRAAEWAAYRPLLGWIAEATAARVRQFEPVTARTR